MAKIVFRILLFAAFLSAFLPLKAQFVSIGEGSYTTQFPGTDVAGRNTFPSGTPYVSGAAASKPVPTNDWWSNFIKVAHGGQAFNYPLSYRSYNRGLAINYTMPYASSVIEFRSPMDGVYDGIIVGVENLNATSSTISDFSDWTVTANWQDGTHNFTALMGHGMPFTYFTKDSSDIALIEIGVNPAGVTIDGNKLIIENNYRGADYIAYAPTGSVWSNTNNIYSSDLNGKNYWSIVMVPQGMTVSEASTFFEKYAYVFPAETEVSWNFNDTTSLVTTEYSITPDVKEGADSVMFWGILPHHWSNLAMDSPVPASYTYNTVRGELKVLTSNSFETELRYSGILPALPNVARYSELFNPVELYNAVEELKSASLPTWTDSYNQGQEMNRLVQTARIADQIGYIEARDEILLTIQERLEDWLTAETGEVAFLFYYNNTWDALIGYPAGHRQDANLNDHHFHWGYFIHSAAFIEQYNPGWANNYKDFIDLLVRDAANPSRDDNMFPFLRNFSPYAGHSWANGFATEPFGNDQESTSESMQFNSALIHWGTITGNDEIRDLGIYLYTTENSSVNEYWFDQNDRTFQPEYGYEMVARIWGGGYDNGTWWTTDPAASYGIQLYPIHGGSLYLGHDTNYVQEVWNGMTTHTGVLSNVENVNLWYDTYWKFLSLWDADLALTLYNNYRNRSIKVGISDAQTYQWLHSMVALGNVADEITADYPIAAVFSKDGEKTYAAHNYGDQEITVNFSDGYSLVVPAKSRATNRDINVSVIIEVDTTGIQVGEEVMLTAQVSQSVNAVEFYMNGTLIGSDNSEPYTINSGSLDAGFPGFYAKAIIGSEFNLSNVVSVQVGTQQPYSGTAYNIPGTIEAGNYDTFEGGSGQGICYYDVTSWNEGGHRPSEAVDAVVEGVEGATVGWIEANEWMEYTVNVLETDTFSLDIRYASGIASGGGPFHILMDGVNITGNITVGSTGGWSAWRTKTIEGIELTAGEKIMRVQIDNGGFNLGKMTFYDPNAQTNINISESLSNVSVYPVIVEDYLNVNTIVDKIQVYNVQGIEVKVVENKNKINLSTLDNGVYLVWITLKNETIFRKIIKR